MLNPRMLSAAGFGLVLITTILFGMSATSLGERRLATTKVCPPATVVNADCPTRTITLAPATVTETKTEKATPVAGGLSNAAPVSDSDLAAALVPTDDENFNLTEALTKYTCYPAAISEARQMALDTVPSVDFNVVRGDNLVLSRKAKLPGQTFRTWYSVGRKPSAGCWTYHDRFSKYKDSVPRFLRSLGSVNGCNNGWKKAFVIHLAKGQSWTMDYNLYLRSLITEAGWVAGYHVYILTWVDGDRNEQEAYVKESIPDAFRPLVVLFNSKDLQDHLGADVPFDKYENNMHVAVQKFMHENSQYEFVYFIDSNSRFTGRWDTLLKSIDDEYAFHRDLKTEAQDMPQTPDLVIFDVPREPDEKWTSLQWKCLTFFNSNDGADKLKVRRSLGSFGGYSRRMVDALSEVNAHKINCHSDYFAPTVAAYKGLTTFFFQHPLYAPEQAATAKANALVSGNDAVTIQKDGVSLDYTYSGELTIAQSFWDEWIQNEDVCRPEALLHPVTRKV